LTPSASSENLSRLDDDLHRLFFTAFDFDDQRVDGEPLQSVVLPVHGKPITFSVYGNQMALLAKERGDVILTRSKRVCNVQQIEARQSVVRRIRRANEAIDQCLEQLATIRNGAAFNSAKRQAYAAQQKKLAAHHQSFVLDCKTLRQIWTLDPETASEYHSWTLHRDDEGVTAIFLPDVRPGEEGLFIEARFWFGSPSMPKTLDMPAADVHIVPDCIAPYRPFDVPVVWREEKNACSLSLA
jgi:hypothetical protein